MQKLNRAEVEMILASGSSLAGSDLSEINLSGVDFSGSDMSSCDLRYRNLTGALLDSVNLTDYNMGAADLSSASLLKSTLKNVDLRWAILKDADFSEEILWWTHLQRWSLSLIANGLWLPQIALRKNEYQHHRARWVPLLNQENERKRLEEFIQRMPLAVICSSPWIDKSKGSKNNSGSKATKSISAANPIASSLVRQDRNVVINILEEILDSQLRKDFEKKTTNLDPLLAAWQASLCPKNHSLPV